MSALLNLPRVIVLCVLGGSLGALSVVRTLGRAGVPVTVVSGEKDSLPLLSKYCSEPIFLENFTANYNETLAFFIQYAKKQNRKTLLFPTADPDLKLLSNMREELKEHYHLAIPEKNMVEIFMDKRKFSDFARMYDFPVPNTYIPQTADEVFELSGKIQYPIVMKPAIPSAWTHPEIQKVVNYKKAVIAYSRNELIEVFEQIVKYSNDTIIQEYIPGSDDNHYDLQIYMNKKSEPIAVFTGKKTRTCPPYTGAACFVESVYVAHMAEIGMKALRQIHYTGLADFDFKKDSITNEMKLIEINPRVSQWNIFPTICGVNLPFIAYADIVGVPFALPQRQRERMKYVYLKNDFKAFLEYRKNGDWTIWSWLCSLRGRKIYQTYARDDLKPFVMAIKKAIGNLARKIYK